MKYVSKEKLQNLRAVQGQSKTTVETLDWIINAHTKEIPNTQWQTIEDFKANPVAGWCWIVYCGRILCVNYSYEKFNCNGILYSYFDITHVLPIRTPEAP